MDYKRNFRLILGAIVIAIGAYGLAKQASNPASADGSSVGRDAALAGTSSIDDASPGGASVSGSVAEEPGKAETITLANGLVAIAPPPISSDVFPCSDCHDPEPDADTSRIEELFHEEIVMDHDNDNMWCYSCHSGPDRGELHLSSNEAVPLSESYRLCGQCHGSEYRNWEAGDHGKRTGSWSGVKEYRLCSSCHDAHSPRIQAIEPLPAPLRQELIR